MYGKTADLVKRDPRIPEQDAVLSGSQRFSVRLLDAVVRIDLLCRDLIGKEDIVLRALIKQCAQPLLLLFNASEHMLSIGVPALRTLSLCFIVGGFTIVSSSLFQALGKGLMSMSIAVFRQLVLVLPLAYVFSLSGNLNMVWWAFPVAEVLAGILTAYYLRKIYQRVIRPLDQADFKF